MDEFIQKAPEFKTPGEPMEEEEMSPVSIKKEARKKSQLRMKNLLKQAKH